MARRNEKKSGSKSTMDYVLLGVIVVLMVALVGVLNRTYVVTFNCKDGTGSYNMVCVSHTFPYEKS